MYRRGSLEAVCDIGQITFPFGGIFFTHTGRQLTQLGASQVTVHKLLGFEVSKDSVDRMIPQAPTQTCEIRISGDRTQEYAF